MILVNLIRQETGVPLEEIMLLRHSSSELDTARKFDVPIEEYTAIQPIGTRYDFFYPGRTRITIVVTIVNDRVYAVYRVSGIEAEGAISELASESYLRFERSREKSDKAARRFALDAHPSSATGLAIHGWENRTRTPVQRLGDGFFDKIEVDSPLSTVLQGDIEEAFRQALHQSTKETSAARQRRLLAASPVAERILSLGYIFNRNPDVVAEILSRANGVCQDCGQPAPFNRRGDGSPYLEVHHRMPLAEGGQDTIENAIALCPNCHRKAHYG